MRFVKDWDTRLIQYLGECDHEKPIITVYPRSYKIQTDGSTKLDEGPPVVMAFHQFN